MDRKEVEALLAYAERRGGKQPTLEQIAALCRTQLAVWDAPVGTVREVGGSLVMIGGLSEPFRADARRVRIVPEGA